ncbi:MAG: lipopolysaccharide transport periplasmic protein LptA [Gammaproteobacteria bacterium]|nr:lipopolysaccharide transport periplasmic protein LptA [Gammaproteobacteria bacterium]
MPVIVLAWLLLGPAWALETDRQQPLEVNADTTDGILGDGVTTLSGNVEIRQGSLMIRADRAEVDKADGKVRQIKLLGNKASLQQEIEQQGMVKAWAQVIEYQVSDGQVVLSGAARVEHPQYDVSGEKLRYDLDKQHFEGNGDASGSGRVHIRLDPEVASDANGESAENSDQPPPEPPSANDF